jgi:uncharacterized protein (DUF305 family)
VGARRLQVGIAAGPLLTLALAGCGGGGHEGHSAAQTSATATSSAGAAASTAARAGTFNQQDVAFAQNMIMHHRQALELAALAGSRTGRAEVKAIADSVSASQAPEVDLMTRWLGAWGAPVPEDMSQMDMSGSMPGMQSLADMTRLAGLSGTAFDQQFLTMMKDHHEGAITMARQQLGAGSDAEAKNLASQVIVEQGAEIGLIRNLLT